MGITTELARFSAGITKDALPVPVIERTRYLLLDLIGNIVRGRSAESTPALVSAVHVLGLDRGEMRLSGTLGAMRQPGRR